MAVCGPHFSEESSDAPVEIWGLLAIMAGIKRKKGWREEGGGAC